MPVKGYRQMEEKMGARRVEAPIDLGELGSRERVKIKILYVIDNIEFGGGERGFLQLIQGLDQKKYLIRVACTLDGEFGRRLRDMGVLVEPVNMKRRFNPFAILKLAQIIRRGNFHIVHSQGARADFFSRIAIRLTHHPYLISTVQMPVEGFNVSPIKKWIYTHFDRWTEPVVDRFIVVSDSLREALCQRHGIDPQKVIRIYNGVEVDLYSIDPARRKKVRREWGIPAEVPLVVSIGRLVWQKGFPTLIEAAGRVLQEMREVRFVIVGEGPLKGELESRIRALELGDRVFLAGFRSDIPEILSAADLFVLSSLREGLPMVMLEAMATGRSIVASDIEGIREQLRHGESGLLVPPGKAKPLAEAILRLLAHKEEAATLGQRAKSRVEELFTVERTVQATEIVYKTLMTVQDDLKNLKV